MSKFLAASALAIALGAGLIACTAPEIEATTMIGVLAVDEILNDDGTCAARPGYVAPRQDLVYVGERSDIYHRPGCRLLAGKRRTCITHQSAVRHDYRRCLTCRPA